MKISDLQYLQDGQYIITFTSQKMMDRIEEELIKLGYSWSSGKDLKERYYNYTENYSYIISTYYKTVSYDNHPEEFSYQKLIFDEENNLNTNYCFCHTPKMEKRFSGISNHGQWFDFCIICRKEIK
jgi:hypothetical protein